MSDLTAKPSATPRQVGLAALVGTTVEWYDFYLFSVSAALIFGPQFFPSFSSAAGTLSAFATFAVGFVARPIGALIFGHLGDRLGRKNVLIWSLLLTGTGTVAVGLLPNFASIGLAAPILLVLLRIVQGIGVGGESGGAVVVAGEHAPTGKLGQLAGMPQLGSGLGLLTANGAFLATRLIVGGDAFSQWGWRVPFLLSVVMIGVGSYMRLRLVESPDFEAAKAAGTVSNNPVYDVFRQAPTTLVLAAGAYLFNNLAFFTVSTFALSYLKRTVGISETTGLGAVLLGATVLLAGVYYLSWLSDRVSASAIIVALYVAWIPFIFVFFALINTGSTALIYAAIGSGMLLTAFYGPLAGFLMRQFDTAIRFTGLSLAVQLGALLGGGIGPLVATELNSVFNVWAVAGYVVVVAVISIAATLGLSIREKTRLRQSVDPARVAAS